MATRRRGLANRLHGFLNVKSLTLSLPLIGALWDSGPVMRPYVVGDLVLEVLAVWTLVLVMSGLYLWWPRRTKNPAPVSAGARRGLFRVRYAKRGRARWRDLHGVSGVLLLSILLVTIVSGLGWSTYWGPNFTALANKISPNIWTDAPLSPLGTRGDLDRFGNQIPWNTADAPLPASLAIPATATVPRPVGLDAIVKVAAAEHMQPGYSIAFPPNVIDEKTKTTTYGTYTLSNVLST